MSSDYYVSFDLLLHRSKFIEKCLRSCLCRICVRVCVCVYICFGADVLVCMEKRDKKRAILSPRSHYSFRAIHIFSALRSFGRGFLRWIVYRQLTCLCDNVLVCLTHGNSHFYQENHVQYDSVFVALFAVALCHFSQESGRILRVFRHIVCMANCSVASDSHVPSVLTFRSTWTTFHKTQQGNIFYNFCNEFRYFALILN